ncbi:MAG: diguanylate cyclase [Chloroflexi bacterium]|nr:diguanylate cyclase [Chloroflexota bacterium]
MMFKRASAPEPQREPAPKPPPPTRLLDPETGLPNYHELAATLRREIARARRYGDRSSLAVFEVKVASFKPSAGNPHPPSPARFVAGVLHEQARESDLIARLDTTHFVVFLTECDTTGASLFTERTRTRLSTFVYARNEDGTGIFLRARAGFAAWEPALSEPNLYIQAAFDHMDRQLSAYSAAEGEFRPRPTG